MPLRPGRSYHHIKGRPWTRISIRVPPKSYVKGVPASKIHQFEMGSLKTKDSFPVIFSLATSEDRRFRTNALEAARQITTKYLSANLGEMGFFLKIRKFPHDVLRENPMATGAGADRFSQGMRQSWGKPIGQAARIYKGGIIMTARVPEGKEDIVKEALDRASKKLPGACRVIKGA